MYNRSEKEEEYFLLKEMERLKAIRNEHAKKAAAEERQRLKELHFMHCAKCGQQMETTTLAEVEVDVCPDCGGIYLDAGELGKILEEGKRGPFANALAAARRIFGDLSK